MNPAFNADKRPYTEFSWVVFSTKARFNDDTTRAIVERSAQAPATAVNIINQTGRPSNHPPPDAPLGSRDSLHDPLAHPAHVSGSSPGASAAPPKSGNARGTPIQAVRTPALRSSVPSSELSTKQGKAPLRFGQASSGSARPLPSQAPKALDNRLLGTTTPASISTAQHIRDTVHPSQRASIDTTDTPDHVAQAHTDHARLLKASMHHVSTPESGPSQAPRTMPIRSSVSRDNEIPLQSTTYSPTPGPSSRIMRPHTKSVHADGSPYEDVTKTPGAAERKKQVASDELETPRSHSNSEQLPLAGTQPPVAKLSSRAAGKQPVRSAASPVDASSPSASRAQMTVEDKRCKTCPSKHFGKCRPVKCRPVCSTCSEQHFGGCKPVCSTCGKRHPGACWGVCGTCGNRHPGICWKLSNTHAKNYPLPDDASKQDNTPKPQEQNDAVTSLVLQTTSNTESVETAEPEVDPCKHRRRDQECLACDCGCGKCHRPDTKCKKQRLEEKVKTSKKRKADDRDDADDGDTADAADDANVADVKVEASASDPELILQPKKKVKKEAKKTKKVNRWWEIIVVED
jgi:hypothetical protein